MTSLKTLGLLLQSTLYLDQKKILKVLTPEQGLLSFFAKTTSLSPFCVAEWVYLKSNQDLHRLQDTTLLDPLLELRQDYHSLLAAGAIAQDLLRTQFPGKKSPFALAHAFLRKLPLNPQILAASFRLKLLFYEGLFAADPDTRFTPAEWEQVHTLAFSRQFSQIIKVTKAPHEKIQSLFEEKICR